MCSFIRNEALMAKKGLGGTGQLAQKFACYWITMAFDLMDAQFK